MTKRIWMTTMATAGAMALAGCGSAAPEANGTEAAATEAAPGRLSEATPEQTEFFLNLERELWAAWSRDLKAADAASFYSKDPQNLHFDIAPLKFTGWEEYVEIAQQALPPEGGTAQVNIQDDFQVLMGGPNLAVVSFTWSTDFFRPDGSQRSSMEGRETDIWELEEDGNWRITHQHMSVVPSR